MASVSIILWLLLTGLAGIAYLYSERAMVVDPVQQLGSVWAISVVFAFAMGMAFKDNVGGVALLVYTGVTVTAFVVAGIINPTF